MHQFQCGGGECLSVCVRVCVCIKLKMRQPIALPIALFLWVKWFSWLFFIQVFILLYPQLEDWVIAVKEAGGWEAHSGWGGQGEDRGRGCCRLRGGGCSEWNRIMNGEYYRSVLVPAVHQSQKQQSCLQRSVKTLISDYGFSECFVIAGSVVTIMAFNQRCSHVRR